MRRDSRWIAVGRKLLLGALACGLVALDSHWRQERDVRIAQAAYTNGKSVGHVLGECEVLGEVVKQHSGSAWSSSLAVNDALAACTAYQRQHAPGMPETVRVP